MQPAGPTDLEVARLADRALATLHERIASSEVSELSNALDDACDAWDRFGDLLPGFREHAP